MERVNATDGICIHKIPFSAPCSDCKAWRADDPPAGEFTDGGPDDYRFRVSRETRRPHSATCDLTTGRHYDNECTCGAERTVSRETAPEPKRGPEWLEPDTSVGPPEFEELGVWSPSAADYRRWEFFTPGWRDRGRMIPDWYGWEAEEATWD
jgi:hypothetical protein